MPEGALFDRIPEWIEMKILNILEFDGLLNARATCQRWNEYVNPRLGEIAILNINMDKTYAAKQFRRGKWNSSLIAPYQEIRVIPKPINAFLCGKAKGKKNSNIKCFTEVKKFTMFENGSFLQFLHRYVRYFPNIKYIQIREFPFAEKPITNTKYTFVDHAFSRAFAHPNSWSQAMQNLSKVETLRIRIFDRLATLLYMQLFTFRMTNLTNVELDFTKLYDNPMSRHHLNEINCVIVDMLEHAYLSLKHLRLKWAVRVDTELDYARSDEDFEPFLEFLFSLRNPIWLKLRLQQLTLSFPTVNLGLSICETTLLPFLLEQEQSLKRVCISRIHPGEGVSVFLRRFRVSFLQRMELSFYFRDEIIPFLIPQPQVITRGLEILVNSDSSMDFSRLTHVNRGGRVHGLKYFMHFKLINARENVSYVKPDILRITDCFHNIRILEILDTSSFGKTFAAITNSDFYFILRKLTKLVSLKLSNASNLTDCGLTRIDKEKMTHMKKIGVFHMPDYSSPFCNAKELRFLDLRDLSSSVSDFAVYFAFQQIKKLENIAFHGNHSITSWGKEVLKRRYRKNPFFHVTFRPKNDERITYGNYALPSADFP